MPKNTERYWRLGFGNIGFGLFLLLLGTYFIGKELGWFSIKIPIWPIILIVAGMWMILSNLIQRY